MDTTLDTAERATEWLKMGGGWAMFVLSCVAMIYMVRYIRDQTASRLADTVNLKDAHAVKVEQITTAHKAELATIEKEHREQIVAKDAKIFALLDKTNDLLKEIQSRRAS